MRRSARDQVRVGLLSAAALLMVLFSTACAKVDEAATSDGVAAVRTTPPCYLNGATPPCPGMLAGVPADSSRWKDIDDAVKAVKMDAGKWTDGQPSNRFPKINGNFVQEAHPSIHPHARDPGFDLYKIPINRAVVVAGMKFKQNVRYPDAYYLAGASGTGENNVLVVYQDGSEPQKPIDGDTADKYIAKWRLFEKNGSKAIVVNSGYIRLCAEPSQSPVAGAYAQFHPCNGQRLLMKLSDSLKIPLDTIRSVMKGISQAAIQHKVSFAQELGQILLALNARSSQFKFPRTLAPAQSLALLTGLTEYPAPEEGPLWISCGQGCCTVDTEK